METLASLLQNPYVLIIVAILLICIIKLIQGNKVASITKDGIVFNKSSIEETVNLVNYLSKETEKHSLQLAAFEEDIKKLFTTVQECHRILDESVKGQATMQLALLRLQIMSPETSEETKLHLYDEYKKLGGNSYIDKYMSRYIGGSYGKD